MPQTISGKQSGKGASSDNPLPVEVSNIINTTAMPITLSDSGIIDPFDRIRVSEPYTIFDSKQIFDNAPLFYDDQEVSGSDTGSTYSQNRASTMLDVSASTAGKRVRQTFMRFNYQPGKGQRVLVTGVLQASGGGTGIKRGMGYYDDNNGIFLQDNEGTIQVVKRSYVTGSAVDTEIDQPDWNLDKMDGTGASGITLDFTKAQIFFTDMEWLGVGRVRCGFVIDGILYYCHQFVHANIINSVYMSTPNLPIRYEIENDGNGDAAELEHICSSVESEGGRTDNGLIRHATGETNNYSTKDTIYIVLAFRLKSTALAATILWQAMSVGIFTNDFGKWGLKIGGTPSTSLSFIDVPNSSLQIFKGTGSETHTGGISIDGGFIAKQSTLTSTVKSSLSLGASIDGTPQVMYFLFEPQTNGTSANLSVTWRELS